MACSKAYSAKMNNMKPSQFRCRRISVGTGLLLSMVLPLSLLTGQAQQQTGGPRAPSLPPRNQITPAPLPGLPLQSCLPSQKTTMELLQAGLGPSEIMQAEQNSVACKVNPAVVEVLAYGFGAIPGQEYESLASATQGRSIGTGVLVSADGYVVTNRHVIRNAPKLTVILHSNDKPDEPVTAELKGQDEATDLAVLKIEKTGLPFLEFNLQPVHQGDTVFAFGSPHGVGISMTKGIISAPIRQVKDEDQQDYIQTDAAINKGNSGGALVDIKGRLVGVNSFILSESGGNEGINFAIPAGVAAYVYNQIKSNGYVIRGTIGVTTRNLTPELVSALKLPVQVGVYVEDVEPKGPAETAGVEVGDVIVAYDGIRLQVDERRPDPALEFRRAITQRIRGAKIQLDVLRNGVQKSFNVVVNQASPEQFQNAPQLTSDFLIESLGIYGLRMTSNSAALHNLRSRQGVLVSVKVQSMQAQVSDLQVDDLITQINGKPVSDLDDLRRAMDTAESGSTVVLQVERARKYMLIFINVN